MRSLRLLVLMTAAAVMLLPGVAWACKFSCRETSILMPADGATDVPLNARIWVGEEQLYSQFGGRPELRLVDATDETEIPLRSANLHTDSGRTVLVFTPEMKLSPNTTYRVDGSSETVLSFTTGTTEDTTPPELPEVRFEETVSDKDYDLLGTSCGSFSTYGARYGVAFTGLVAVVDVKRLAEIPAEFGDVSVSGLVTREEDGSEQSIFVGQSRCGDVGADPGSLIDVRFGTYDIAGNFSGFTEPLPVKIPSGCGCASGSEASSALLLGVALLRWKRKRAAPAH